MCSKEGQSLCVYEAIVLMQAATVELDEVPRGSSHAHQCLETVKARPVRSA